MTNSFKRYGLYPHNNSATGRNLPKAGDLIDVAGHKALVSIVEPANDWEWHIEADLQKPDGSLHRIDLTLPTDYRTDDGMPSNELEDEHKQFVNWRYGLSD